MSQKGEIAGVVLLTTIVVAAIYAFLTIPGQMQSPTGMQSLQPAAIITACGNVNESSTLGADITFAGAVNCINITEDNITLDCQGHKITADSNDNSVAIYASNRNNITIKNCKTDLVAVGVKLENTHNSYLQDSTVNTSNPTIFSNAIYVITSDNNTITNSTIKASTAGLRIDQGDGNIAEDLTIVSGTGHIVLDDSSHNYIARITATETTGDGSCMSFFGTAGHNTVINSTFQHGARGLYMEVGDNSFENVNFTSLDAEAIELDGSGRNNFTDVVAITKGTSFDSDGVKIHQSSNNNFVRTTIGSGAGWPALYAQGFNLTATGDINTVEISGTFPSSQQNHFVDCTFLPGEGWIDKNAGNIADNNTIENTTFKTALGSIRLKPLIVLPVPETQVTSNQLDITKNRAFLNSSNITEFNTSAHIRFNYITSYNGNILVDPEDDGTFINCTQCENITYDGTLDLLEFDVPGFTTYSANATTQSGVCGDEITNDTTLTQDLQALAEPCFEISASDLTLDCAGHSITSFGGGKGIALLGNNITVKNCNLYNFSTAIEILDSSNNTVQKNNISSTDDSIWGQIYIHTSTGSCDNNRIENNDVRIQAAGGYCIYTLGSIADNNYTGNNFLNYGGIAAYIRQGDNALFRNNRFLALLDTAIYNRDATNSRYINTTIELPDPDAIPDDPLSPTGFINPETAGSNWIETGGGAVVFNTTLFVTTEGSVYLPGSFNLAAGRTLSPNPIFIPPFINIPAGLTNFNYTAQISVDYPPFAELNQSAQITFNNVTLENFEIAIDYDDDNTYDAVCPPSICTIIDSSRDHFIFNVTHWTTYGLNETEGGGLNGTLSKTDSPDPVNVSSELNYTIQVNITGGTAYNLTVTETYPGEVAYQSASPSPNISNNIWQFGDVNASIIEVNISVLVNAGIANGTVIENTVNITYQNSTGDNFTAGVDENTTVLNPGGPGPTPRTTGGGGGNRYAYVPTYTEEKKNTTPIKTVPITSEKETEEKTEKQKEQARPTRTRTQPAKDQEEYVKVQKHTTTLEILKPATIAALVLGILGVFTYIAWRIQRPKDIDTLTKELDKIREKIKK